MGCCSFFSLFFLFLESFEMFRQRTETAIQLLVVFPASFQHFSGRKDSFQHVLVSRKERQRTETVLQFLVVLPASFQEVSSKFPACSSFQVGKTAFPASFQHFPGRKDSFQHIPVSRAERQHVPVSILERQRIPGSFQEGKAVSSMFQFPSWKDSVFQAVSRKERQFPACLFFQQRQRTETAIQLGFMGSGGERRNLHNSLIDADAGRHSRSS